MIVGHTIVGQMMVGQMIVGQMIVGQMIVGQMIVGQMNCRSYDCRSNDPDPYKTSYHDLLVCRVQCTSSHLIMMMTSVNHNLNELYKRLNSRMATIE